MALALKHKPTANTCWGHTASSQPEQTQLLVFFEWADCCLLVHPHIRFMLTMHYKTNYENFSCVLIDKISTHFLQAVLSSWDSIILARAMILGASMRTKRGHGLQPNELMESKNKSILQVWTHSGSGLEICWLIRSWFPLKTQWFIVRTTLAWLFTCLARSGLRKTHIPTKPR